MLCAVVVAGDKLEAVIGSVERPIALHPAALLLSAPCN